MKKDSTTASLEKQQQKNYVTSDFNVHRIPNAMKVEFVGLNLQSRCVLEASLHHSNRLKRHEKDQYEGRGGILGPKKRTPCCYIYALS